MVGRDAEVGVLERVLDDLWAGGSAALVVTGEPGIGKTRLLEELGLRAADRGAVVVSGRAAEYEVDLPLAVWIDALEPHVAATGAPDLSERDAASLAEALPSLAHDPGATVPERHRVHAAMRSLLAALAEDRPLVVVLDDLHWADPASVDLIAALLRRPPAAEVLLALSSRLHQAPERLEVAFARALREHHNESRRLNFCARTASMFFTSKIVTRESSGASRRTSWTRTATNSNLRGPRREENPSLRCKKPKDARGARASIRAH